MGHTGMRSVTLLGGLCVGLGLAAIAQAGPDGAEDPAATLQRVLQENAALRERVGALEKTVSQLVTELQRRQGAAAEAPTTGDAAAAEADRAAAQERLLADARQRDAGIWPVWSGLDVQFYGKIKLNAAIDSARTSTGNYARWVEAQPGNPSDTQFNMTANETRLGLNIRGPKTESFETSGQVEVDFYGGGGTENKPNLMLRHAYMKLAWPQRGLEIIAGQTWDVISPRNPSTLNYPVQWWAGNIGYRRPQVRVTQGVALCDGVKATLSAAATRNIGRNSGFDPGDTGEDAGMPGLQGRAAVSFPLWGERETTVGVSSHWAREEYDTDGDDGNVDLDSWSANLDVQMPICDWLSVQAELFGGQNLDAYLGSIGSGVDVFGNSITEVRSFGGWVAASLGPWDRWRFNVGFSGETVNDGDVDTAGARTCNQALFGNTIYELNENASVGLEISHWHTGYVEQDDRDSVRVQGSFIYQW